MNDLKNELFTRGGIVYFDEFDTRTYGVVEPNSDVMYLNINHFRITISKDRVQQYSNCLAVEFYLDRPSIVPTLEKLIVNKMTILD